MIVLSCVGLRVLELFLQGFFDKKLGVKFLEVFFFVKLKVRFFILINVDMQVFFFLEGLVAVCF